MLSYYVCFRFYGKDEPKYTGAFVIGGSPNIRTKLFGHCFMLIETAEDRCMILDKTERCLKLIQFPCNAQRVALELKSQGVEIYDVPVKKNRKWLPEFFSCTGLIKDTLGIKEWWIITPRQLWRKVRECTRL